MLIMKNRTPLQRALRKNQREKKLPELLQFLSPRLKIPEGSIQIPDLDESDAVLEAYRSMMSVIVGDVERRLTFDDQGALGSVLRGLGLGIVDEMVYLYSTPLCDVCGSVRVRLHHFLDRAAELVAINSNAVYVIPADSANCIDLTYDTEYSADSGPAYYVLTVKGDRYLKGMGQI